MITKLNSVRLNIRIALEKKFAQINLIEIVELNCTSKPRIINLRGLTSKELEKVFAGTRVKNQKS